MTAAAVGGRGADGGGGRGVGGERYKAEGSEAEGGRANRRQYQAAAGGLQQGAGCLCDADASHLMPRFYSAAAAAAASSYRAFQSSCRIVIVACQ